jgi:mono/diheme cytochrome c family protein
MRITVILISVLALLVFASGCGGEDETIPDTPDNGNGNGNAKEVPKKPDVPAKPAVDPGMVLVKASCTECHAMDQVSGETKNEDDWFAQVEMCMDGKGLSEEDTEKIVSYLAKEYGAE